MELQEFAPHLLQVQLIFKDTSAAIVDQRGAMLTVLKRDLEAGEGNVELAAVEAFSEDKREQYRVGTAQVVASIENFEEFGAATEKLRGFAEMALDRLERPPIALVRARTFDLAATASFEALRDALADSLGTPKKELAEVAGKTLSDIGWVYEFTDGNPNVTLRFGPMKASQLKTMLRDQRDSQYPGEFLFLDTDYAQIEQDLNVEQALERLTSSVESNRNLTRRMANWLTERLKP